MTKLTKRRHRQRITVEFVMSHYPCWEDAETRLRALLGRRGKTMLECLNFPDVSDPDKIWLATRPDACSERVLRLFAAACAERVLPMFESRFSNDERPRVAIQTAVRFALGHSSFDELDVARAAAYRANAHAGRFSAAAAAADDAADAAAAAVDGDAVYAATEAAHNAAIAAIKTSPTAERAWQVETLRALLEDA